MTIQISCPNCMEPVDSQARFCEHCGVDLALAAAVAERTLSELPEVPRGATLSPEALVPRIGDTMIEMGILTVDQLERALEYQQMLAAQEKPLMIGQVLIELGVIDRETLDRVVTIQIHQFHSALKEANLVLEQRVQERTQDLQRALSRLGELNQLKANFISNISHELRTPLTHLKGYLDLMAEGVLGPLSGQQTEAMQVLQRAEGKLEQLIEDLIQFSLASHGELRLFYSPVDLCQLLRSAADRSRSKANGKDINFEVTLPPALPLLHADEEKLSWMVMQLLDNALKFTQPNGKVNLSALALMDGVQVIVSDTGIGIPPDRIQEIFEPFHQLDGSTTRRYGGTGLGLAMVRRILDAHGGTINVVSEPGKGTSIIITLPIKAEQGQQDSKGLGEMIWSTS